MKEALKKLFTPDQPTSITATVQGRISTGRYQLADDSGRILQADSGLIWSPGSRVIVQAGRIVSAGGQSQTIKTYEV